MASGLVQAIKQATKEYMENSKPTEIKFGKVTSTDPLKIRITNQFELPEELLIVPQHLTEYKLKVNGGELLVNNKLEINDKVAILRSQQGKYYYILDRLPKDED